MPQLLDDFCNFSKKLSILIRNGVWITIRTLLEQHLGVVK